jgi:hypothetical protein
VRNKLTCGHHVLLLCTANTTHTAQHKAIHDLLSNPVISFVVDVFMMFPANVPWRGDVIPEIEDGLHGMSSWNHNSTLIPYNFLGGIHIE